MARTARHPLEPLDADEITAASLAVRRAHPHLAARFPLVVLHEPPKEAVRADDPERFPRKAFCLVLDRNDGAAYEGVVDLRSGEVDDWRRLDGIQPPILVEEFTIAKDAVKADRRWREAVRKRGIDDFDKVQIDPWSAGDWPVDGVDPSRRLLRAACYYRDQPTDNGYAKPIENVIAIVDLNAGEVVDVIDGEVVPVPEVDGNYDEASVGSIRADLKPLDIIQLDGPSFSIDGNLVTWQKWSMRVSLHPTDGIVLHRVGYEDGSRVRTILYRASMSEMVVPYGDATDGFHWRNAFDAGEYGMGRNTGSLTLGCDCLGVIEYLDAVMANDDGEPETLENAICIHEEDFSILWKHWDIHSGSSEVRRSRRLVVSSIATLGNYEYGFYWYFYQDGHIDYEIKLTGIVQTRALPPGESDPFGTVIAPGLSGVHHQHLFNVRLDFEVDGPANSVVEVDTTAGSATGHDPHRNAMVARETTFMTERQAIREIEPTADRYWKVVNPSRRNALGAAVSYKLVPRSSPVLLAQPDSRIGQRAAFASHHLWVTPFEPREMHAAGDYPNQRSGPDGLPVWTAQDRPIEDTDVVVWHSFGTTHVVRPEDWPVMPVATTGFSLLPNGFFERNPSLDVPAPESGACRCGDSCSCSHDHSTRGEMACRV